MTDKAVREAQAVLKNLVCECGHIESVHIFTGIKRNVHECTGRCRCKEFRPVEFVVTRKA